jgi:hypothetical protein
VNNQDIIRSAGAIVFRLTTERHVEVLLVGGTASDPEYWGFPKGRQSPLKLSKPPQSAKY